MRPVFACVAAMALAAPAMAADVTDCYWANQIDQIVEPWEENTRGFANNDVRLSVVRTLTPGGWRFHLAVLSPPFIEDGWRQCQLVGGFLGLDFAALEASYDPAVGLVFDLPVEVWTSDLNTQAHWLRVTLNQATGLVTAAVE